MKDFKDYNKIKLKISGKLYNLYVADSDEKRYKGLSGIPQIPGDCGMLFLHPKSVRDSYTMENTYFPLAIIFIDQNFNIVDQFNAQAFQKEKVRPKSNFKYVIEIPII